MCRPEDYPPYDTAYPSTPTGENDPPEWEDEMSLAHRIKEERMAEEPRVEPSVFVLRLHDVLVQDPRGCEHPRFMKPQCERIAAQLHGLTKEYMP